MKRREFILTSTTLLASLPFFSQGFLTDKKTKPLRFGIITDIHYDTKEPAINRYYAEALDKVKSSIKFMNEQNVEFVAELGDLKDGGKNKQQAFGFLDTIEAELQRLKGGVHHVIGNHDVGASIAKSDFLSRVKNAGFEQALPHYSFNQGSWHFVVLDANFTSAGVSHGGSAFDWKDCHVPQEQLDWLQKDLKKNRKKPTIVFLHHPLDESSFTEKQRHYCPDNSAAVRVVLEEAKNVSIVFSGHYHKGFFNTINGISYYGIKSLVEGTGPGTNSFVIVDIDENRNLVIKGYEKAESYNIAAKW